MPISRAIEHEHEQRTRELQREVRCHSYDGSCLISRQREQSVSGANRGILATGIARNWSLISPVCYAAHARFVHAMLRPRTRANKSILVVVQIARSELTLAESQLISIRVPSLRFTLSILLLFLHLLTVFFVSSRRLVRRVYKSLFLARVP